MEEADIDDLPSFFSTKSHVPEGVSSLIGELEEAGLLEDEDDENLEMNMETFGAASMAEFEQSDDSNRMMTLEEVEAGFKAGVGSKPSQPEVQPRQSRPPKNSQNKNMSVPPGFQPQGRSQVPKISQAPPGFVPVMPPPGMLLPSEVDPATGKTILAPHVPLQPPPMNKKQGIRPPTGSVPPPPPPPGQNIWDARSVQQQQNHQHQQFNPPNQQSQNYQTQRNQYTNQKNSYTNNNNRPVVPKKPFVALPASVPKRGKLMSGGEVATVLHAHMRSLEITDPYREDFYYHNFMLKEKRRQLEERNASLLGAKCDETPGGKSKSEGALPMPVWQDTKEKLLAKKDKLWSKFAENTKEWEEKNKVFGHTQKSNPHRPKALLNLSTSEEQEKETVKEDEEGEEIFMTSSVVKPFSNKTWGARKAIEDAKVALLVIDELRRLLNRPDIDEIQRSKTSQSLSENFQILQKALGFKPNVVVSNTNDAFADPGLLEAIATQDKGKKLLARVFKLLRTQAALMLPIALKAVYAQPPVAVSKEDIEAKCVDDSNARSVLMGKYETEDMFLDAVVDVINLPPVVDPVTMAAKPIITYHTVKTCLENIIKPHVASKTLGSSLRSKYRVEVVQAIMKKGELLAAGESEKNATYWRTLTKAFLDLASKNP